MRLSSRFVERAVATPPGLRWHRARLRTRISRSAFAGLGAGTVIVRQFALRGTRRITIGAHCAIFDGVWVQSEDGGAEVVIGDHTYLGVGVHVHAIDTVRIGSRCVFADSVFVASTDHDRVDRHAVHGTGPIGAGGVRAVLTRDVAAGTTVVGAPARHVGTAG